MTQPAEANMGNATFFWWTFRFSLMTMWAESCWRCSCQEKENEEHQRGGIRMWRTCGRYERGKMMCFTEVHGIGKLNEEEEAKLVFLVHSLLWRCQRILKSSFCHLQTVHRSRPRLGPCLCLVNHYWGTVPLSVSRATWHDLDQL